MGPDLLAVTPAHSELRGQLPQTPRSRLIGFQHLHTQIIRIRLCHRLVFAKIAKPTMTALPFPAYNYCDSALERGAARAGLVAENLFSAADSDDKIIPWQWRHLVERGPEKDAVLTVPKLCQHVVVDKDLRRIRKKRSIP